MSSVDLQQYHTPELTRQCRRKLGNCKRPAPCICAPVEGALCHDGDLRGLSRALTPAAGVRCHVPASDATSERIQSP